MTSSAQDAAHPASDESIFPAECRPVAVAWPVTKRGSGFFQAVRSVNGMSYTNAVVVLFLVTSALGCIIYLLEYEWNIEPVPEMPRGERAIFRYELTAEGDWTHILVTYRRLTKSTARGFLPGLHAFLDRLEAQLDGRVQPEWMRRFNELRAEYPEWEKNAADPGK
jgi:hypothetical protein